MKISIIGGGPAGLYVAVLAKLADPSSQVTVYERNRADDTFGFGVVFSDATLERLANADRESYDAITESFFHWDDIDVFLRGERFRSTGHGFSGMSRKKLLHILQSRASALGAELCFSREIASREDLGPADLVVVADGVNSALRERYKQHFRPTIDLRPNRFVWLGTTFPFEAFTFYFKETEHGLFMVHAYRYDEETSTFIVECTGETFARAGLDEADEDATVAYLSRVFAEELAGHPLLKNRSVWRRFPTIKNAAWHWDDTVLLGDAVHTAHFSIGSGTKLAMEDAITLIEALRRDVGDWSAPRPEEIRAALGAYEAERRPVVDSIQRAAQVSLEWFETAERAMKHEPLEFAFSLLTRSLRVTHENLALRDPAFVARVDRHVAERAAVQSGVSPADLPWLPPGRPPPPMLTAFRLRDVVLPNRVGVSAMCMYSAEDGFADDWHLVHLGSRAIGGAGLVMTEMTDVSAGARISPGCTGLYEPGHAEAFKRIVDFVHRFSPAKIGVQLGHAGRKGSTRRMWEGIDQPLPEGNWPLVAPSPLPYHPHSQVPAPLDRAGMDAVREDFVRATELATTAGFDLLEVHCAHGYLLASFLSPLTNRRTDGYGGSIEGRARFPLEVVRAVREAWPDRLPLSVRVSATDWKEGGIEPGEVKALAQMLKEAGADIIDVSTGQTVPDAQPEYGRLFQVPFSDMIRNDVGIPTMTVGNISSYTDVNGVIAARRADVCLLARAHLYDPYWTHHAAAQQDIDLPWPDPYPLRGYRSRFS